MCHILSKLISVWFKELNLEEPAGFGGPLCEHYVLDSRGALVERQAVVCRERLILGHCLVLSVLVVRTSKILRVVLFFALFLLYDRGLCRSFTVPINFTCEILFHECNTCE